MSANIPLVIAAALLTVATSSGAAGKAQTTCPVSGRPIDKSQHVDWQGQRVYFCCGSCPAKFKADPEKYFASIAADGVELENIQTTCPVSGEKLGEMGEPHQISFQGRAVKFCCPACEKEFRKNPGKYLALMPGEQPNGK